MVCSLETTYDDDRREEETWPNGENTHIVRQEENVPPKQALSVPLHNEYGGSHAKVRYETAGGKSKLEKWGHTANTRCHGTRVQRPTEGDLGMARVRIIMP